MNLITWNLQWGRGVDGRVDFARIVARARSLGDFDVICLQEVADNFPALEGNDERDQFAEIAALLPGYEAVRGYAVDIAGANGRRSRFGNMILSRLPVSSVRRHALPWPADSRRESMARMAVEATVAAPFGTLRVTTTHLEYYSDAQRLAQAARLRELHAEACSRALQPAAKRTDRIAIFEAPPQTVNAVLTGDFNFPPENPEYAEIQAPIAAGPRYRDAWESVHGLKPHDPTFCVHDRSWKDTPYCCDFVFASEGLPVAAIAVDPEARESDHQPVFVTLG